jgi:hypothetical protein
MGLPNRLRLLSGHVGDDRPPDARKGSMDAQRAPVRGMVAAAAARAQAAATAYNTP